MLTRFRTPHTTAEVPAVVIPLSIAARAWIAVLLIIFDGGAAALLVYAYSLLSSVGLAIFILVVMAAMTWALVLTIRTRTIVTKDEVVLKYGFFPTVRIPRSTIVGVDVRAIAYYLVGGQKTFTPHILTSDGGKRAVFMLGRQSQRPAEVQAALLRRHLAV